VLSELAGHEGLDEPAAAAEYVRALVHTRVARLLSYRAVALNEAGQLTQQVASLARLASIQLDQEVAELAADVCGPEGLAPAPGRGLLGHVEDVLRYSRSATIASGTIEVQRLVVARAALEGTDRAS
jgi:alkylation response protein AidB-like acyl-CoA dehydrogenase